MKLANKLLIALPNIKDPNFNRAVIYICSHNENGSLGLIVNSPSENLTIGDTLTHLNLPEFDIDALKKHEGDAAKIVKNSIKMPPQLFEIPVLNGGPVEHNRGFILHSQEYDLDEHTIHISKTISMTSTTAILSDISLGKGPEQICFAIGYVGWGANQLEDEIAENSWLVVDADDDIIFNHEYAQKYEKSMQLLGIKPENYLSVSNIPGHA
ncbi:MAG: YqgE/AlgH family protein [Rhizobiales bacterium]|nr:YqgE/AlgH family protein [Hyphomicrobiales bacterium]